MTTADDVLGKALKGHVTGLIPTEDIVVDALRDMLKDDVKRRVRDALDQDPALRQEFREAVGMLFEAKLREAYAQVRIAKASAKLGLSMMPDELRAEFGRDFIAAIEKEMTALLAKSI
ncbi:MAG: hypothetical protein ACT4PT_07225 [Methanobacteriota archaeon]